MLRTIVWISYLFIYMLLRLPYSLRMRWLEKKGRLQERQVLIEREVALWAQRLLKHIGIQIQMEGLENLPAKGEVVVFAANHQSFLDIPILLASLSPPPPLLARREIGKVPLLGFWMRQLGCVFVQREDARSGMAALKEAQAVVENGRSIVIFPEGTRSKGEAMGEFLPGAVRIASKAAVPVVPVVIDGSYKYYEGNRYYLGKGVVRVSILPAVITKDLSRQAAKELPADLQKQIQTEKDKDK